MVKLRHWHWEHKDTFLILMRVYVPIHVSSNDHVNLPTVLSKELMLVEIHVWNQAHTFRNRTRAFCPHESWSCRAGYIIGLRRTIRDVWQRTHNTDTQSNLKVIK